MSKKHIQPFNLNSYETPTFFGLRMEKRVNHRTKAQKYLSRLTSVPIRKFLYKAYALSPDFFSSITFNSIGLPAILVNLFIFLNPIQNSLPKINIHVRTYYGTFQLEFVSISQVKNHMTCHNFKCSHWWKIY